MPVHCQILADAIKPYVKIFLESISDVNISNIFNLFSLFFFTQVMKTTNHYKRIVSEALKETIKNKGPLGNHFRKIVTTIDDVAEHKFHEVCEVCKFLIVVTNVLRSTYSFLKFGPISKYIGFSI